MKDRRPFAITAAGTGTVRVYVHFHPDGTRETFILKRVPSPSGEGWTWEEVYSDLDRPPLPSDLFGPKPFST